MPMYLIFILPTVLLVILSSYFAGRKKMLTSLVVSLSATFSQLFSALSCILLKPTLSGGYGSAANADIAVLYIFGGLVLAVMVGYILAKFVPKNKMQVASFLVLVAALPATYFNWISFALLFK